MQIRSLILVAGITATASATIPANPVIRHLPVRAVGVDGSWAGLIFKRQSSCPEGYNSCGTGCAQGPCCDAAAGIACRPGEVCTTIDNAPACCADGYVCGAVRGCQAALGSYCAPGSIVDGVLCCDAAAPLCSTSSGMPYCAGAAPSTVYTVAPTDVPAGADTSTDSYDSTTTLSMTETNTYTITMDSTSNALTTDYVPPTETTTTDYIPPTETTDFTIQTSTDVTTEVTTETTTSESTVEPTILPTAETTTSTDETTTSTYTATVVVPLPYPTNGTNATVSVSPPQATGSAGRIGVSGFALSVVMGLAFLF